jgi:hypothetical protein
MAMQLYSNNASAQLAASITAVTGTINVAPGKGALFSSPSGGDWEIATLSDSSVTTVEIVKITSRSTDALTVVRGQEGTVPYAWPSTATIQGRLTKGTLESFLANHAVGSSSLAIGVSATAGFDDTVCLGDSAASSAQNSVSIGTNAASTATTDAGHGNVVVGSDARCIRPGQTAIGYRSGLMQGVLGGLLVRANSTAYTVGNILEYTGSLYAEVVRVTLRRIIPDPSYSVSLGEGAYAQGNASVALGYGAKTVNVNSVAIKGAVTSRGIAILGQANGLNSAAIGAYSYLPNGIAVGYLPDMTNPPDWYHGGDWIYSGVQGMFMSEPIDLSGGATWTATTSLKQGYAVKPTTPNGKQYSVWSSTFGKYDDPTLLGYVQPVTGASEPTWPTSFGATVVNGGVTFICVPHDGTYQIDMPATFVVEEILFVCFDASTVSTQASISIGKNGALTSMVNNQPTVGLTANNTVTRWSLSQPYATDNITIKINTLATATRMLGRFVFKGFMIAPWV